MTNARNKKKGNRINLLPLLRIRFAKPLLEREPQSHLELPGEVRLSSDLAERTAAERNIGPVEQWSVRGVQCLAPELRFQLFTNRYVLEHRHIPVHLARSAHIQRPAEI